MHIVNATLDATDDGDEVAMYDVAKKRFRYKFDSSAKINDVDCPIMLLLRLFFFVFSQFRSSSVQYKKQISRHLPHSCVFCFLFFVSITLKRLINDPVTFYIPRYDISFICFCLKN